MFSYLLQEWVSLDKNNQKQYAHVEHAVHKNQSNFEHKKTVLFSC